MKLVCLVIQTDIHYLIWSSKHAHPENHLVYLKMFLVSGGYQSFRKHTEIFRMFSDHQTWHNHAIQKCQMFDCFWAAYPLCQQIIQQASLIPRRLRLFGTTLHPALSSLTTGMQFTGGSTMPSASTRNRLEKKRKHECSSDRRTVEDGGCFTEDLV